MAEAFGVVAGALGLAVLFTTAVESFEYIQLGRHFGEDYQRAQLKLDIVTLRLLRWGRAVNILNEAGVASTLATATETAKAKEVLVNIVELFLRAEKWSSKYKLEKRATGELEVWEEKDMGMLGQALHRKMKDVARRRQRGTGLGEKVKWALYRNKEFTRLVEDVTEFVEALESIFPTVEATTRQLAALDISEMVDVEEAEAEPRLKALEGAAEEIDPILGRSILDVKVVGNTYKNIKLEDSAKIVIGNYYAESTLGKQIENSSHHSYEDIHAKGNSRAHIGDIFGGRSIFDD